MTRTAAAMSSRTYADAIALLNTLQSNRKVVDLISDASYNKNKDAIPEMLEWTRKAGYKAVDFAQGGLRFIHVAGTKGKGSVCVMIENVLLQYRGENRALVEGARKHIGKIGLYTSPHLVTVRERIRIDGIPISEALFTRYFFEIWDRLSTAASMSSLKHPDPQSADTKPGYFRYLTILAFHIFLKEEIETAIVECGIGGEYDSTNILPEEAVDVAAITLLGIDHTGMLGGTISEIAWHKAGIIKTGVPVFSVEQPSEAQSVINQRAEEKGLHVEYVKRHPDIKTGKIKLGLEGDFQKDNASLAAAVASSYLQKWKISADISEPDQQQHGELPNPFIRALEGAKLQARCEVRTEDNIDWLIDGAHTLDSIKATARWYSSKLNEALKSARPPTATMLIFNQQDRDANLLVSTLINSIMLEESSKECSTSIKPQLPHHDQASIDLSSKSRLNARSKGQIFTQAAFCMNTPFKPDGKEVVDLKKQQEMGETYAKADRNQPYKCFASVEEAIALAHEVSKDEDRVLILVTGSLHLAGGLIEVLDSQKTARQQNH
jgi:folylpolyglutamate synthase